jgi:sulfatase modifying factor 1
MSARFILGAILISLGGFAVQANAEGRTFRDCSGCPMMVLLPPGKYLMGTAAENTGKAAKRTGAAADPPKTPTENAETPAEDPETENTPGDDEGPQHPVTFKRSFAIGKYPVTRAEFTVFVRETRYDPKECFQPRFNDDAPRVVLPRGLSWRNPGFPQTDRDPVVCVSFDDAKRYARWLSRKTGKSYRLPSEAEWEYAARAGTRTPRYWSGGDSRACRFANVRDAAAAKTFRSGLEKDEQETPFFRCRDGYIYTAPVGSFQPNRFGLYDMLGNAWQWTADCYRTNYKDVPADGSPVQDDDQDGGQDHQTRGCSTQVLRGGSWANPPGDVRSAYRHGAEPGERTMYSGFRVARKR